MPIVKLLNDEILQYQHSRFFPLAQAIEEYIKYYNEERIKSGLKSLTLKEYRNQAAINPVF